MKYIRKNGLADFNGLSFLRLNNSNHLYNTSFVVMLFIITGFNGCSNFSDIPDSDHLPKLVIEQSLIDLGVLYYEASPRKQIIEIPFRNEGEGVLELKELRLACSCMEPQYESSIEPKQKSSITITLRLPPEPKKYSTEVIVHTNEKQNSVHTVRIEFDLRSKYTLKLAEFKEGVTVLDGMILEDIKEPSYLDNNQLKQTDETTEHGTIDTGSGETIFDKVFISNDVLEFHPGETQIEKVSGTAIKKHLFQLVFDPDNLTYPQSVKVQWRLKDGISLFDDVQISPFSPAIFTGDSVFLGLIENDQTIHKTVEIEAKQKHTPFVVEQILIDHTYVRVLNLDSLVETPLQKAKLEIQCDCANVRNDIDTTMIVSFKDSEYSLKIPIRALVHRTSAK